MSPGGKECVMRLLCNPRSSGNIRTLGEADRLHLLISPRLYKLTPFPSARPPGCAPAGLSLQDSGPLSVFLFGFPGLAPVLCGRPPPFLALACSAGALCRWVPACLLHLPPRVSCSLSCWSRLNCMLPALCATPEWAWT